MVGVEIGLIAELKTVQARRVIRHDGAGRCRITSGAPPQPAGSIVLQRQRVDHLQIRRRCQAEQLGKIAVRTAGWDISRAGIAGAAPNADVPQAEVLKERDDARVAGIEEIAHTAEPILAVYCALHLKPQACEIVRNRGSRSQLVVRGVDCQRVCGLPGHGERQQAPKQKEKRPQHFDPNSCFWVAAFSLVFCFPDSMRLSHLLGHGLDLLKKSELLIRRRRCYDAARSVSIDCAVNYRKLGAFARLS